MSSFLRDEQLKNLKLNEDALNEIKDTLLAIDYKDDKRSVSYIIRFDNQGFRLSDYDKVLEYFRRARQVERFIYILKSDKNEKSFGLEGKSIELNIDNKNIYNCQLCVQDDDNNWVGCTFLKIKEVLNKYQSWNWLIRNSFTAFFVQTTGILIGLLMGLWGAIILAPRLNFESAMPFAFIIIFLLFLNIWGFIYPIIMRFIDNTWPNVSFKETISTNWFFRGITISLFWAVLIFALNGIRIYFTAISRALLK